MQPKIVMHGPSCHFFVGTFFNIWETLFPLSYLSWFDILPKWKKFCLKSSTLFGYTLLKSYN